MSSTNSRPHPPRAPVRRIVTGHNPEGTSIVVEDAPITPRLGPFDAGAFFTDLFWTDRIPASNDVEFRDLAKEREDEIVPKEGTVFRVVEIPPGHGSPFHRTLSLDYGILTHGQVTLYLGEGKRVVLKPGDAVVLRGGIHRWANEGTEWTRMYFVGTPAKKVKVGDAELDTEFRV